jgi:hypothetical protein
MSRQTVNVLQARQAGRKQVTGQLASEYNLEGLPGFGHAVFAPSGAITLAANQKAQGG